MMLERCVTLYILLFKRTLLYYGPIEAGPLISGTQIVKMWLYLKTYRSIGLHPFISVLYLFCNFNNEVTSGILYT